MKSRLFLILVFSLISAAISAQSVMMISGSYCTGSGSTFILQGSSCTSYSWSVSKGTKGVDYNYSSNNQNSFNISWLKPMTNVQIKCTYTCNGLRGTASSSYVTISTSVAPYTVSGGGNICSGGSGVSIRLSDSQSGISYQLKRNGSNDGSPKSGTGSALTWSNKTAAGTYTVTATSCPNLMNGSARITVNPLPTLYSVSAVGGVDSYCEEGSGVSIRLSDSQSGVNYQLKKNGANQGSAKSGTGSALTWTNQTAGTYTVVAANASTGCVRTMSSSVTITADPLPTIFSVGGGGGCGSIDVTLNSSQSGVEYQLYRNGSRVGISAKSGTGSSLRWSNQTTPGTYTIIASNSYTGCSRQMGGSAVLNPYPAQFTVSAVSGVDSYCVNDNGVSIRLSGSQTGVNYQLKKNGANNGSVKSGTGSALTWSNKTAGTYTVVSTNSSSGCSRTMSSSVGVTEDPLPVKFSVSGGGGCGSIDVTLNSSQSGVEYQLYYNGSRVGISPKSGTGSTLKWNGQTTPGTYTVIASNSSTGCSQQMGGEAVLNAIPAPFIVQDVGGVDSYCSDGNGVPVRLSDSQTGVNYQLKKNGTDHGSAKAGTGGALTWYNQKAGIYTVVATNISTGCSRAMPSSFEVTEDPVPAIFPVAGGGSSGNIDVTLQGSQPGVEYQLYLDDAPMPISPLSGTGSALAWNTQTAPGKYKVVGSNPSTGCSVEMGGSAVLNPYPAVFWVGGGGTYCSGGEGVDVELNGSQTGVEYQLKIGGTNSGDPIAGTGGPLLWPDQKLGGLCRITATNITTGCSKEMNSVDDVIILTLNLPNIQAVPTPVSLWTGDGTSWTPTVNPSGTYSWQATVDGFMDLQQAHGTDPIDQTFVNLGTSIATTTFEVTPISNDGCAGEPVDFIVRTYPKPTITLTGDANGRISLGPVTLDVGPGYSSIVWKNGNGATVSSSRSFSTTTPGTYTVTVAKSGLAGTRSASVELKGQLTGVNENYIIANTVRIENIDDDGDVDQLAIGQRNQDIQYFDGLGRAKQTVSTMGSAQGKDLVQPIAYDDFGREAYKYLPYVVNSTSGDYIPTALADQDYFYNSANTSELADFVARDNDPYARTIFEDSPLGRVLKQGAPGTAWQPDPEYDNPDNAVVFEYKTNGPNEVSKWEMLPSGFCKLSTDNYYEPNELLVTVTKDENWVSGDDGTVKEYKDKEGRVILKRMYEGGAAHDTYYLYDNYGNLRIVLPPEAINQLGGGLASISDSNVKAEDTQITEATGTFYYLPGVKITLPPTRKYTTGLKVKPYPLNVDFVRQYMFTYTYDHRQRLVEKKMPGAEPVYMVYDERDRLVLTQDGNQRASNQWTFTKYDALNRPVLTGTKTISGTRDQVQTAVKNHYSNQNNLMYEVRSGFWSGSDHGYTDQSYPVGIGEYDYLTVTYYDDYSFIPSGELATYGFDNSNGINDGPYRTMVKGQVTGIKTKVLGDNEFLKTTTHYDDKYRAIQTRGDHYNGDTQDSFTEYDFIGQVLKSKLVYNEGVETIEMTEEFEYDHAGRLLRSWHQMNDQPRVLTAEHFYNELGELIDKKLHYNPESDAYAQSVDYRYNIRGWLTSINNASRKIEAGVNDETDDLFGMNLLYNTDPLNMGMAAQHNGNIAAMAWSNASYNGTQKAYSFAYDKLNRLKAANYKEKTAAAWSVNTGHFSVTGIDYDQNGNIELLKRKESNTVIDELEYTYDGNRLLAVDDKRNHMGGFKDGEESSEEYLYDANGNMITDKNKEIANISYNLLNLPVRIDFENGNYLEYIYDAVGTKLAKKVYEEGPQPSSSTRYVGVLIFENDTLRTIQTAEGRIVAARESGAYTYDYEYYLKDHLGNNRVVFKSDEKVYRATMENGYERQEEAEFKNISTTRENNVTYNYTVPDERVTNPNKSALLNSHLVNGNGTRRIVGPAKSLKVYPGDVIDMEVWARYAQVNNSEISATTFLFAAMTASFGITPGDNPQVYNAFNSFMGGTALFNQAPGDVPKAFLNYVLFDKNYGNPRFGFAQVGSAANGAHQKLTLSRAIDEEGYMYIYVSNESSLNVNVYFDDLKIVHQSPDMIVQANDYYPFGLTMKPSNFVREGELENDFLYNGKELQTDLDLNWHDYGARMYDAAIGRWQVIDPLAEWHYDQNPYNYTLNNPTLFIDPDGLDTLYFFDQAERPKDNGTEGETYTATIFHVQNGKIVGIFYYGGSTYDNSKSNTDNSSKYKIIKVGDHPFSNKFGHKGGKEKGLNLGKGNVDKHEDRKVPGEPSEVKNGNFHAGHSDLGNADSRGSKACLTCNPAIADDIWSNLDWSGTYNGYTGNTGNSTGIISIRRGGPTESELNNGKLDLSEIYYFKPSPVMHESDNTRVFVPILQIKQ